MSANSKDDSNKAAEEIKNKKEIDRNDLETVLGEPVFLGLDTKTQKIRSILLLFCVVSLLYQFNVLEINQTSYIFLVKLTERGEQYINYILSFFILYFLIDFGWRSTDAIREWRIRSTGRSQLSGVESTFGKLGLDYPKDPRNSNIYFWFLKNEMALDNPLDDKIFQADRVVVSMKRFDEWYKNFHRSQNWRFIMVDIGIPFLVAMGTLPLLVMK